MMKVAPFVVALLFAAAVLMMSGNRAAAQILPDSIFNEGSQAFGNTVQDAPPDISKIRLVPPQPKAGKKTAVQAVIATDQYMSAFKVNKAILQYSTDGQNYKQVSMKLADAKNGVWSGEIPAMPVGTRVDYAIAGWDEIGNAVYQIPLQKDVAREGLFKVITDDDDADVAGGMNILSMSYGTDGRVMHYCQELKAKFQTYTLMKGVFIDVMGFVESDVRFNKSRSMTENMVPFLAFIPAMSLAGKMMPDDLKKGVASKEGGISVTGKGNRVCAKAPISELTKTPKNGLKVYSATASFDPKSSAGVLVDATPYAVIYFGGNSYTVK